MFITGEEAMFYIAKLDTDTVTRPYNDGEIPCASINKPQPHPYAMMQLVGIVP